MYFVRLYRLSRQLADFPAHFTITYQPHPVIKSKTPVMEPGDIRSLTGIPPSRESTTNGLVLWTWQFDKESLSGLQHGEAFDMPIHLAFQNGLLSELHIPEKFRRFVTPEVMTPLFKSVAKAKVTRSKKLAEWKAPANPDSIMRREEIFSFFGPPHETQRTNQADRLTFRYHLEEQPGTAPPPVIFTLDIRTNDNILVRADVRFGELGFIIDLTPTNAPAPAFERDSNSL